MHSKGLFVFVVVPYVATCGCASTKKPSSAGVNVSVKFNIVGDFSKGNAWSLEVKPDSAAHLSIEDYSKPKQRDFKVSSVQLAELVKVIETERFYDLDNRYGDEVPDSSTRTLSIVGGTENKIITLRYLRVEDARLQEDKRAIRVWNTVRQWFDDVEAVDLRPYDQRLLDAP